jgi:hypothetical protein
MLLGLDHEEFKVSRKAVLTSGKPECGIKEKRKCPPHGGNVGSETRGPLWFDFPKIMRT